MYLHLGVDYMVKNSEIIAIFNLNHPQSVVYDDFVKKYGSISSVTLKKRAETGFLDGAAYTNLEILKRR